MCTLLGRLHQSASEEEEDTDATLDMDSFSLYQNTIIELGGTSVILIVPPNVVAPLSGAYFYLNSLCSS